MRRDSTSLLALVALCLLSACGGDAPAPDAATPPLADAFVAPDAAMEAVADAFVVSDDAARDAPAVMGGGSIEGDVTRSAMPAAGGRGDLYVAVFTTDPVTDRMGAVNVANARIENVDMSAASARVPYRVTGIPTRSAPYFVTAFLDDNGTVDGTDPSRAGPDRGDLVALEGFSSIRVTVADETPVPLDIDLNFNLPF